MEIQRKNPTYHIVLYVHWVRDECVVVVVVVVVLCLGLFLNQDNDRDMTM